MKRIGSSGSNDERNSVMSTKGHRSLFCRAALLGPRLHHDLGLGAEDVANVEPLLVTYNNKGEVEGVKYDRVGVVLVNAVKEQQTQIESLERQSQSQQKQIGEQRKLIEALRVFVCSQNPTAEICKPNK